MSYAGDLSPHEAWAKLESGAVLVDVRTEGEWAHIGIPDTTSAGDKRNDPLFIQWNLAGGVPNPHFVEQLQRRAPEDQAVELVFLCRSGVRSIAAATAATARPATPRTTFLRASKARPTVLADVPSTAGKTAACPPTPERF